MLQFKRWFQICHTSIYSPPTMKATHVLFLVLIFFTACQNPRPNRKGTARDTTINASNSFSELFLDSPKVEKFIAAAALKDSGATRLRNFYNSRNYQFAWFTKDGLAEHTRGFINLHNSYIKTTNDSTLGDKRLHEQMNELLNNDSTISVTSDDLMRTELQLTAHFFKFAQHAYAGRVDPEELQWHIPRKKVNVTALLDTLIANKGKKTEQWEPVNQQYKLMNKELIRYAAIAKSGGWNVIVADINKEGNKALQIQQLKQRLSIANNYNRADTSRMFSKELLIAVKQAQKQYGIKQDGFLTAALIKELNISVKERIEQLLVNMERMRWMPAEPTGRKIIANIPDFKLHVFEQAKKIFDMDIVVGTDANKTVVFNDLLQFIVFSPYWNVPPSIVRKEILPAINRNPNYLSNKNMEQTGTENGLPVIRQKPGGANSLGKVKFMFPNSYNIYFHDTPSKSLFDNRNRAFSHGCIRVANPEKLAQYLLRNQPGWTVDKINNAMNSAKENWVKLEEPIPVLITYFTAWIDNDGLLHFRNDLYGNDKKMQAHLFVHQ
jgi:murein L,D-transpeptidase YcbB/YkuD